jgi:hypothetical protein
MPPEATFDQTGISFHQIRASEQPKINQYIEERITASHQVKALVSTLAELVPGFEESYKTRVASEQADLNLSC